MTRIILTLPDRRSELIEYLEDLATPDPRPMWEAATRKGLIYDLDQVYHFFFDDNDFDDGDVGRMLLGAEEVEAIAQVKTALDLILKLIPKGTDDQFVDHPLWPEVTRAARRALAILGRP